MLLRQVKAHPPAALTYYNLHQSQYCDWDCDFLTPLLEQMILRLEKARYSSKFSCLCSNKCKSKLLRSSFECEFILTRRAIHQHMESRWRNHQEGKIKKRDTTDLANCLKSRVISFAFLNSRYAWENIKQNEKWPMIAHEGKQCATAQLSCCLDKDRTAIWGKAQESHIHS